MAEVTGLRSNALPYPVYGAPWGATFPILDSDGDLVTGATGLDSEVSKNGDTFADCTNEATEIATSSGMYYLLLTATEMTSDVVTVIVKTTTVGAKTTPLGLITRKLPTVRAGTAQAGAASTITLDSGASAIDDYYNGCLIIGTLDSTVEARVISDYVGSTKVASVVPDWVTTPDSDDTFVIKLPDGVQVQDGNLMAWIGVLPLALTSQFVQVSVGAMQAAVITATSIAANAFAAAKFAADYWTTLITSVWTDAATRTLTAFGFSVTVATNNDKTGYTIANGGIAAASFAAGAIDAAAIAANAIGASEIAAGAITSTKVDSTTYDAIADAVADEAYDGAVTLRQSTRLANSANGAKLSGAATTNVLIRDLADSKNRVDAVVDADGNRTAVTRDLT